MTVPAATTTVVIPGLKRFTGRIRNDRSLSLRVTKMWEARYRGFTYKRFVTFSRGGGDWAPLSPRTIAARRKGRGTGTIAILRDTSQMLNAMLPSMQNAPGALSEHGPFLLVIGYGGPAKHAGGGSATIADIASFHNDGAGHLPQRKIIVPPSSDVMKAMAGDCERVLKDQSKKDVNG